LEPWTGMERAETHPVDSWAGLLAGNVLSKVGDSGLRHESTVRLVGLVGPVAPRRRGRKPQVAPGCLC
jgi:hypothetical protein